IGQINFYLEALDRDERKPNENPSIGILLCKGKGTEVVEYALSRSERCSQQPRCPILSRSLLWPSLFGCCSSLGRKKEKPYFEGLTTLIFDVTAVCGVLAAGR